MLAHVLNHGCGQPGHLAPRGPPGLPPLRGVPLELGVYQSQSGLVELATAMVRNGVASSDDWDPGNPAPGRIIERAVERTVSRINRRVPDALPISAFVRPWSEVLEELFVEDAPGEQRWVLGLDSDDTHRLRVGPLLAVLGEEAAALVLSRLMRHTPLCMEGPEDLEWIIDGWLQAATEEGSTSQEIAQRAKSATRLGKRIDRLLTSGYALPLGVLPLCRIRRLLGMLETLARTAPEANATAWQETDGVEWGLPHPVLHLIWDRGCALDHAVDEAECINGQDGSHPMPQQMWLLDPRDADDAARTWSRWVHALRQVSVTTRLLHALEQLTEKHSPSP